MSRLTQYSLGLELNKLRCIEVISCPASNHAQSIVRSILNEIYESCASLSNEKVAFAHPLIDAFLLSLLSTESCLPAHSVDLAPIATLDFHFPPRTNQITKICIPLKSPI